MMASIISNAINSAVQAEVTRGNSTVKTAASTITSKVNNSLNTMIAAKIKNPVVSNLVGGIVRNLASSLLGGLFGSLFGGAVSKQKWNKAKPSIGSQVHIIDTVDNKVLTLNINPNKISEHHSPKIAEAGIPGLSHPKVQWISGGGRKLKFTIDLFYFDGRNNVITAIDFLRSLKYPTVDATGNYARGAHPIQLVMGNLYKNEKWFITDLDITMEDLFDPSTLLPLKASIAIELVEYVSATNIDYKTIRNAHAQSTGKAMPSNTAPTSANIGVPASATLGLSQATAAVKLPSLPALPSNAAMQPLSNLKF